MMISVYKITRKQIARPKNMELNQLMHVHDLLLSLDDGTIYLLASLDLSAAFNTIDHHILLHRLQHDFGLSGTVLDWFSSYLSGRIQSVSFHSHTSVPASVSCGVPQGSVLGPILFVLYTTPLRIAFLTSLTLCGSASTT